MKTLTLLILVSFSTPIFAQSNDAIEVSQFGDTSGSSAKVPSAKKIDEIRAQVSELKDGIRSYRDKIDEALKDGSAAVIERLALQNELPKATGNRKLEIQEEIRSKDRALKASNQTVQRLEGEIAVNQRAIEREESKIPALLQQQVKEEAALRQNKKAKP